MSDSRGLEDYLSQMRTSGEVDSEGHFTVAGLRAVGKLAVFLLHHPSDWILKVVQAACACQAPELRITQARSSTLLSFQTTHPLAFEQFERCLTSATEKALDRGFEHLATALRAVGIGQNRPWVAKLSSGNEVTVLRFFEETLSAERHQHSEAVLGTRVEIGVSYPVGQPGKLGGLIRFGEAIQEEYLALVTRCRACPIPLYLDSRRLDDLAEPPLSNALNSRIFLGVHASPLCGDEPIQVPAAIASEQEGFTLDNRFSSQNPFLVRLPEVSRARSLQRWFFNYTTSRESTTQTGFYFSSVDAPSRVFLVRDGVVVGKKNLGINHPISADIFLNADALRSDLSGLQVHPTTLEEEFAKNEMRAALPFLDEVSIGLAPHRPRPLKHQMLFYGGLGALGLMLPAIALKAAAGLVSTALLANSAQNRRAVLRETVKSLENFRYRVKS